MSKSVQRACVSNAVSYICVVQSKEPERKVQQFHYTTWPDQGVPETCTALIKFHRAIFRSAAETEGPVVIHCRYVC